MNVEKIKTEVEKVEIPEKEIIEIIRQHLVEVLGQKWENSVCYISQISVAPYMGQIDDETETYVIAKIVKETKE